MSLVANFFKKFTTAAVSEDVVEQAIASKSMTDAQARAVIGNASSVAEGLRAVGITVLSS